MQRGSTNFEIQVQIETESDLSILVFEPNCDIYSFENTIEPIKNLVRDLEEEEIISRGLEIEDEKELINNK